MLFAKKSSIRKIAKKEAAFIERYFYKIWTNNITDAEKCISKTFLIESLSKLCDDYSQFKLFLERGDSESYSCMPEMISWYVEVIERSLASEGLSDKNRCNHIIQIISNRFPRLIYPFLKSTKPFTSPNESPLNDLTFGSLVCGDADRCDFRGDDDLNPVFQSTMLLTNEMFKEGSGGFWFVREKDAQGVISDLEEFGLRFGYWDRLRIVDFRLIQKTVNIKTTITPAFDSSLYKGIRYSKHIVIGIIPDAVGSESSLAYDLFMKIALPFSRDRVAIQNLDNATISTAQIPCVFAHPHFGGIDEFSYVLGDMRDTGFAPIQFHDFLNPAHSDYRRLMEKTRYRLFSNHFTDTRKCLELLSKGDADHFSEAQRILGLQYIPTRLLPIKKDKVHAYDRSVILCSPYCGKLLFQKASEK